MLSKCANPECSAAFHYLHEGKLFEIADGGSRKEASSSKKLPQKVEHFWLCSKCALTLTIAVDRNNKILVLPRNGRGSARSAIAS